MQTERLIILRNAMLTVTGLLTQGWDFTIHVRQCLWYIVRLQPTYALIQKKFFGMAGVRWIFMFAREGRGGPRHILSNFTKKIFKKMIFSKVPPTPPPNLLSSRFARGIHSCLIFKGNIVYHIYVV